MLTWVFLFLIVALVAGVLGFTGVAAAAAGIARIIFFVFLVLLIISLFFWMGAKEPVVVTPAATTVTNTAPPSPTGS